MDGWMDGWMDEWMGGATRVRGIILSSCSSSSSPSRASASVVGAAAGGGRRGLARSAQRPGGGRGGRWRAARSPPPRGAGVFDPARPARRGCARCRASSRALLTVSDSELRTLPRRERRRYKGARSPGGTTQRVAH
eukprot:scaffold13_cov377-Prasinococcus_capsulatus_cf.AAC.21